MNKFMFANKTKITVSNMSDYVNFQVWLSESPHVCIHYVCLYYYLNECVQLPRVQGNRGKTRNEGDEGGCCSREPISLSPKIKDTHPPLLSPSTAVQLRTQGKWSAVYSISPALSFAAQLQLFLSGENSTGWTFSLAGGRIFSFTAHHPCPPCSWE